MAAPPARSAAVQIVRPPESPSRAAGQSAKGVPGTLGLAADKPSTPKGRKDQTQRLCRNVLIYGACRNQDSGCTYYHPPPGEPMPSVDGSPAMFAATTASKDTKPGFGADSLAAPVFVPKTPRGDASPAAAPARLDPEQPAWIASSNQGGLMSDDTGSLALNYGESGMMDHSMTMDSSSMYMAQPPVRRPLDYHLYTSPLPHVANSATSHPIFHSFFIPDDLRRTLLSRQEAMYAGTGVPNGLPAEIGEYHSLVPLGHSASGPSRVYSHPAPVYRAVSTVDGSVYVLRRIEGFKLVNEAAFGAIEPWKRMRHPNIVSVREAFTTRQFGDNSLIIVYDHHPDSITLGDEHLNPNAELPSLHGAMPRRRQGMPIPERLLWSYITQIANALKAMHSTNLAARNLDPSKILLTGKNRIRLNGCGILDVLIHDGTTPVSYYQQEDLVSFGKLVISLCCEFFQPGQHPAGALEHIGRHYSPDVKNLVLFLISKPQPLKSVDEVIRMIGPRILNELDAVQNYTDTLESEMMGEMENGRIVRLLTKLGFINERAEFELDPRWSDTGDRYILKLFRDYVFHSIGMDGKPILDLSHVLTCLNKLDAGLDEKIMLVSRDDQSCLVVSYREIKACIEAAYNELRNAGGPMPMRMGR